MPENFIIDVPHQVVFSKGIDTFTYADFLQHQSRLRNDPLFKSDFNQMVDCREMTQFDLTLKQIRDAANGSIFSLQSRRAFIVSSDLLFGFCRIFAAYRNITGEHQIQVFRESKEALSWLNLPPDWDPYGANPLSTKLPKAS